jgi:hypothetical protein
MMSLRAPCRHSVVSSREVACLIESCQPRWPDVYWVDVSTPVPLGFASTEVPAFGLDSEAQLPRSASTTLTGMNDPLLGFSSSSECYHTFAALAFETRGLLLS